MYQPFAPGVAHPDEQLKAVEYSLDPARVRRHRPPDQVSEELLVAVAHRQRHVTEKCGDVPINRVPRDRDGKGQLNDLVEETPAKFLFVDPEFVLQSATDHAIVERQHEHAIRYIDEELDRF